jgi:acid stress chaperone HdeB
MIKPVVIASGLILAFAAVPGARAQVTLDVSKVTCDQYIGHKITNAQNIAIWMSGYYHGKRGDTTLDTQELVANAKKLRSYCFRNPDVGHECS